MASFCAAWCAEIRPRAYDVPRIILDISGSVTYDPIYGVSAGSALIKRAPCCGCLIREMSIALAGIAEIARRRANDRGCRNGWMTALNPCQLP